jgi:TonB family protein
MEQGQLLVARCRPFTSSFIRGTALAFWLSVPTGSFKAIQVPLLVFASFVPAVSAQDDKQGPEPTSAKVVRKSTGVLQNEATAREAPAYPPLAHAAKVSGPVTVEVTIDEEGAVIAARAVSGHPLLKDSAVTASRKWRFNPTRLSGVPVKVIGNIVFNFTLTEGERRDGASIEAERIEALVKKTLDSPDSYESQYELATAYIRSERYNDAISALKEAIRINPESAPAHHKLGGAYLDTGRYDEAIKMYSRATAIDPQYAKKAEALSDMGVAYLRLERHKEAAEAFTESLKLAPNVDGSHFGLGLANFMLGDHKRAVESFKRVLEISLLNQGPMVIDGHFWLGRAYLQAGDKRAASQQYESLKRRDAELAERLLKEINNH